MAFARTAPSSRPPVRTWKSRVITVAALIATGLAGTAWTPASAAAPDDPPISDNAAPSDVPSVIAWGDNAKQQSTVPKELIGKTVVAVAAGGNSSMALTSEGEVIGWGSLKVPASLDGKHVTAIAAGSQASLALTREGEVLAWGYFGRFGAYVPRIVRDARGIAGIATGNGSRHAMAWLEDGPMAAVWGPEEPYVPGDVGSGKLVVPQSLAMRKIIAGATGSLHSMALTDDGKVTAWGSNRRGSNVNVPAGLSGTQGTAISAGSSHSLALSADGKIFAWGDHCEYRPVMFEVNNPTSPVTPPASLADRNVTAISSGTCFSLALTDEGDVTSWGNNTTIVPASLAGRGVTAISAGHQHALAIVPPAAPELPVVTEDPRSETVQTGQPAVLRAEAAGWPPPTMQWQRAAPGEEAFTDLPEETGPYLELPTQSTADSGTQYRAVFTNLAGEAISQAATITVAPSLPRFVREPQPASVRSGERATFIVEVDGDPAPTLQWQRAAFRGTYEDIPGATGTSFETPVLSMADDRTSYRVVATNAAGEVISDTADIQVQETPPIVATSPQSVTLTAGTQATLTADAGGDPTPTVQWERAEPGSDSFVDILGASTTSYTSAALTAADDGARYRARFTNVAGSATTDPATVTVTYPPGAPAITSVTAGDTEVTVEFTPGAPGNPGGVTYTATATPSNPALPTMSSAPTVSSPIAITGLTSGVPYTITVAATNGVGSAAPSAPSTPATPGTAPALAGTAPAGQVGVTYSHSYVTTGAPTPTVTVTGGTLPAGLTLSPTGVLSGTPTAAGTATFTIQASNGVGGPASITNTVTIGPARANLAVALTAPASAPANQSYSYTVTAKNTGPSVAQKVVTSLLLPNGTTFQSATGSYSRIGQLVVWNTSTLANGASVSATVTVKATTKGNKSAVASTGSPSTADPSPSNNIATRTTRIS